MNKTTILNCPIVPTFVLSNSSGVVSYLIGNNNRGVLLVIPKLQMLIKSTQKVNLVISWPLRCAWSIILDDNKNTNWICRGQLGKLVNANDPDCFCFINDRKVCNLLFWFFKNCFVNERIFLSQIFNYLNCMHLKGLLSSWFMKTSRKKNGDLVYEY